MHKSSEDKFLYKNNKAEHIVVNRWVRIYVVWRLKQEIPLSEEMSRRDKRVWTCDVYGQKYGRLARLGRFAILPISSYSMTWLFVHRTVRSSRQLTAAVLTNEVKQVRELSRWQKKIKGYSKRVSFNSGSPSWTRTNDPPLAVPKICLPLGARANFDRCAILASLHLALRAFRRRCS